MPNVEDQLENHQKPVNNDDEDDEVEGDSASDMPGGDESCTNMLDDWDEFACIMD